MGAPGSRAAAYLGGAEQLWYVRRIRELVRANEPRFQDVVHRLITDMLRRWPTDGVRDERVKIQALWTEFDRVPSTSEARAARRRAERDARENRRRPKGKRKRQRRQYVLDHVVPCAILRDWLMSRERTEEEVLKHLQNLCLGALISVDEHERLGQCIPSLRKTMPAGWVMDVRSDPWARYKKTILDDGHTLFEALEFPADYPKIPAGARRRG